MKRALVTGIAGQDGSYLTELLLDEGYEVHGIVRSAGPAVQPRLHHLEQDSSNCGRRLFLHPGALEDATLLRKVLTEAAPQEVYHLAGPSHVSLSFERPEATCHPIAMGTLRLLELLRQWPAPPRLFYASSSEVFGCPATVPQDEATPIAPVNPYGCAKAFATQMVAVYRRSFGLFACNGILYNHESPRRDGSFVVQKICRGAAAIKAGHQSELALGNLDAARDWGHAGDYVRAMWLMLQQDAPDDYVVATGRSRQVREVVEAAFAAVDLDWRQHVRQDEALFRRTEPTGLVGNAAKARRQLGWEPRMTFEATIREMTLAALTHRRS